MSSDQRPIGPSSVQVLGIICVFVGAWRGAVSLDTPQVWAGALVAWLGLALVWLGGRWAR